MTHSKDIMNTRKSKKYSRYFFYLENPNKKKAKNNNKKHKEKNKLLS